MQHIEYVVGFNIDRRVQDVTGSIITVPGASGSFRRKALLQVGGLSTDTLAEDTDLTIALGRAGWRVVFEERARAWTEAPATMAQLWKQRYRWSYGTMQAMWKHRRAIREKGWAGKVGRRGLAHVAAFHILLPLTAPLVDVFFLYGLVFADPALTLLLGAGMLGVQLLTALYAFRLEREPLDVLWVFPAQQVVYRQLMYSVLIRSVASAVSGVAVRWQRMNRIGVLNNLLPKQSAAALARPAVNDHTSALALLSGNELQRRRESRSTSDTAPVAAVTGRERWLDLLKVAALARVIATDVGAPAYLSLFPAWGVLFGIGGSMMASSAQHEPEVDVMGHRLRRLLVPLWVFGIVAVPLMLWQGWGTETDENTFYVANLVFWIFPFLDPPGSTAAVPFVGGLWYIRACLWFVLLTPLMRAGLRRSPLVAVLLPLVIVGLDVWLNWDLSSGGGTGPALMDFCIYAPSWMLGMAYRDRTLRRIHPAVLGVLAVAALAGGALWTKLHVAGLAIDESPLSAALISVGAVILLLSVSPLMAWLDRVPVLRELLGLITGRALTIYLCYPIAIAAAPLIAARLGLGTDARTTAFTAVGLTVLGVLAFGWVEDLSARRPLGLLPRAGQKKRKRKSAAITGPPVSQVLPLPVSRQTGPPLLGPSGPQRVPVLQGAGGPSLAPPPVPGGPRGAGPHRVEAWSSGPNASGPHRPVGERASGPNASGPHRPVGERSAGPNATGPRQPVRPQMRPGQPGPSQPGPQQAGHVAPGRAGPSRPGPHEPVPNQPHPHQPHPHQPGLQPPGPHKPGLQPPGPHHPGPQQPASGRPLPGTPGPQAGPPTHPPFEHRPPDPRPAPGSGPAAAPPSPSWPPQPPPHSQRPRHRHNYSQRRKRGHHSPHHSHHSRRHRPPSDRGGPDENPLHQRDRLHRRRARAAARVLHEHDRAGPRARTDRREVGRLAAHPADRRPGLRRRRHRQPGKGLAAVADDRGQRRRDLLGAGRRSHHEELVARAHRTGPARHLRRGLRAAHPHRVGHGHPAAQREPRRHPRPDPRRRGHQVGRLGDAPLLRRSHQSRGQAGAVGLGVAGLRARRQRAAQHPLHVPPQRQRQRHPHLRPRRQRADEAGDRAGAGRLRGATVRFQVGAYQQAESTESTSDDDGARVTFTKITTDDKPAPVAAQPSS